ncbi:MAG: Gx transporter family protein [Clostridia bacterium]|nr:Gx transporter family protein [Clostridia bacterium]
MSSKKISYISMLSALALVFGYIESLFPAAPIPGIKLGLSNIVILFAIYRMDKSSAFFIMLIKVLATSLLFSGLNVFIYSFSGGLLSLIAMVCFKKVFSLIGVSMIGGVCHNIGQLLVAAFMMQTSAVFVYLPALLISGVIVGFITGNVCSIILKRKNITI